MVKKFEILQLASDCENYKSKLFSHLSWLSEAPNISDYAVVYSGEMEFDGENANMCELIYGKFNIARPDDFTGHSLSVSDIVRIDGKCYYCDAFGFEELK